MTHYVVATEQPWGRKVFELARRGAARIEGGHFVRTTAPSQWHRTQSNDNLRRMIRKYRPRYVFCVNFSSYVPADVLASTEVVNFHAFGPGPVWHRGGGPIENLLLRGYTETLIWAHRMTSEIDAGPVYASRGPVSLAGTKDQILERFIEPVVSLVREIVETEPEPYPQVGDVVMFKRLPKAECDAFWKARCHE